MSRANWGSRLGFVLAASGSAVGLGNIWKFPYITGEYGGGLFVLIYLACILLVGAPVMLAEVVLGRATQQSPVGAYAAHGKTAWALVGWMGVIAGFIILSYYSVVAGWAVHYVWLAASGALTGPPEQIGAMFAEVYGSTSINVGFHIGFMLLTITIVLGGVAKGIEAAAKFLMPTLLVLMLILLVDAVMQPGFGKAANFLFAPNMAKLSPASVLEALGHSFFTLSLGMGAMLTYGSYLSRDTDIVKASLLVTVLDTAVAIGACLVLFPIIFSFGMDPQAGPGLVFASIPVSLSQMTGGRFLAVGFFVLLTFAALSSAISLLEVVVATLIDRLKWTRKKAGLTAGLTILVFGIPSALSGVKGSPFNEAWSGVFGKNFFDSFDWLASNLLLPLGGLAIAVYVGWVMPEALRRDEFTRGSTFKSQYGLWLSFVRYVAPVAIALVLLFSLGLLNSVLGLEG